MSCPKMCFRAAKNSEVWLCFLLHFCANLAISDTSVADFNNKILSDFGY